MRICEIYACGRKHWGCGYCRRHYASWSRHGDPLAAENRRPTARDDEGRKRCPTCNVWLPESDFTQAVSKVDGLSSHCRGCASASMRRHRYGVESPPSATCDMCGGDNDGRTMNVDHDHSCCDSVYTCGNCVRGFLCYTCNLRLSVLENAEWRRMAEIYLKATLNKSAT